MGAQMAASGQAVTAASAYHMALAGNNLPRVEVVDIGADVDDFTDEFMAYYHGYGDGLPGPAIPTVDVHVSPADSGALDLDQHVIDTDRWNGYFFHPETGGGLLLDQCFHVAAFFLKVIGLVNVQLA